MLLKHGKKQKALDPAPICVQSLVKMTKQYKQDSSPQSVRALLSFPVHQGTNDSTTTDPLGLKNDTQVQDFVLRPLSLMIKTIKILTTIRNYWCLDCDEMSL